MGKCTLSEEEKANVTNSHIPASQAYSYTYTCTNMQATADVQYLWRINIFPRILILKMPASELVKSSCKCSLIWRWLVRFIFPESSPEIKTEWEGLLSLHSSLAKLFTPITCLLLDFYITKKLWLQPTELCLGELPIKMPLVWLQSISKLTFIPIKLKGLPRIFTSTIWKT